MSRDHATAPTLAVFLSYRGSLTSWARANILWRELALYEHYLRRGIFDRVLLFSYDPKDHALLESLRAAKPSLKRLVLLTPRSEQGAFLYSLLGLFRHSAVLSRADWIKTNQISGSWSALMAATLTGRPLMLRLGYLLSRRFRLNGQHGRAALARLAEELAYTGASVIVTTSKQSVEILAARRSIARKLRHLPSYIDFDTFTAKQSYDFSAPVLFVGRLEPQKNVLNLARACRRIGHPLDIIGSGSLEPELRALADQPGAAIRLLPPVPNEMLAKRLHDYSVYALPSLHEGLPKSLMEAMACGLVCVGTAIPGIDDLIEDGRTGYLAPSGEIDELAAALRRALAGDAAMGMRAREAMRQFSLDRYAALEAGFMTRVAPPVFETGQMQHG